MIIDKNFILICLQYIIFVLSISVMFLFALDVQAGVIADVGDIGFKIALIKIWKGLAGVGMLVSSYWLLSKRPAVQNPTLARAVAFTIYCTTITASLLLVGQFWPVIYKAVQMTAAYIKHLFT